MRLCSFPSLKSPSVALRVFDERLLEAAESEFALRMDADPTFWPTFAPLQSGVFVLSSPPAEGKTTTAYQILRRLDTNERNVGVIEERPSYHLPGITQVRLQSQYKPIPFADAVHAMRRQGIEVLFLDDVDDSEKAKQTLEAAESGLMILMTVMANDSIGAIERLLRFGISASRLVPILRGVLHQRLVNRICPDCRVPDDKPGGVLNADAEAAIPASFQGAGCENCKQTGVRQRVAVYESLRITSEVQDALRHDFPPLKLRQELKRMVTGLADDLKAKVSAGVTPLSEAERIFATVGRQ